MNNQSSIEKLIISGKKVFTVEDLAVIWNISDHRKLIERIKYYLRQQKFSSIYRGVYVYGEPSPLEIAQKLVPLSYVSLYTTSQMHGLTFQHYSSIYCMSLRSVNFEIDSHKYIYRKVKNEIFFNNLGLITQDNCTFANRERTVCDLLYVFPGIELDNISNIDIMLLKKISKIYHNKRLEKDVKNIVTQIKEGR